MCRGQRCQKILCRITEIHGLCADLQLKLVVVCVMTNCTIFAVRLYKVSPL